MAFEVRKACPMKLTRDCPCRLLVAAASLTLLLTKVSIGSAAQAPLARYAAGHPWSGTTGIIETVEQIMARAAPSANPGPQRHAVETHPRLISGPSLRANPLAPLVSQWPAAPPSGFRLVPGLLSPQAVG